MTLKLLEGFDGGANDFSTRALSLTNTSVLAGVHGNAKTLDANGGYALTYSFTNHATTIVGLLWLTFNDPGFGYVDLRGDAGATTHLRLHRTAVGALQVWRGATAVLLGGTDPGAVPFGVATHVELYMTISDTVGVLKLRVNGKTPAGWSDLTGIDTRNGGTVVGIDQIAFWSQSSSTAVWYVDDIAIADGAGAINNDLLGQIWVETRLPNGNGNYSQLLGSDGNSVDNYLLVDEANADTADYNGLATDGQKDTYTFQDLVSTAGAVVGVLVACYAIKSDAGAKSGRVVVRRAAVDATGADFALAVGADGYDTIFELDPTSTAAWSITNVNAAEFGFEVRP